MSRIAVNVSARQFKQKSFLGMVRNVLEETGMPAQALELEITETLLMDATRNVEITLARLSTMGIRLALDDFGTGYSSLSQLRDLPIDEVKIDKSFVLGMSANHHASFIAGSIIELAHNLGLNVVAEGVEDQQTRKLLAEMGCDKLQGFLVSRPLPDDRLESWLLARTGMRSAAPGAAHRRLFVRT